MQKAWNDQKTEMGKHKNAEYPQKYDTALDSQHFFRFKDCTVLRPFILFCFFCSIFTYFIQRFIPAYQPKNQRLARSAFKLRGDLHIQEAIFTFERRSLKAKMPLIWCLLLNSLFQYNGDQYKQNQKMFANLQCKANVKIKNKSQHRIKTLNLEFLKFQNQQLFRHQKNISRDILENIIQSLDRIHTMKTNIQQRENFFEDEMHSYTQILTIGQIMQAPPENILKILLQKDQMIQSFSQQITKYKAQQIKSKKLVSTLQQKIEKSMPSSNNTSNQFMMPSQFKSLFTNFMTSTVPGVFCDFIQSPWIYKMLLRKVLEAVYNKLRSVIKQKVSQMARILSCSRGYVYKSDINEEELYLNLLNYFQKHSRQLFTCNIETDPQPQLQKQGQKNEKTSSLYGYFALDSSVEQISQKLTTVNSRQFQSTEQVKVFCEQLCQICIYMILQEKPWEFEFSGQYIASNQKISENGQSFSGLKFNKKQFTCIDGFVKEGTQVTYVLKGLKRKQISSKNYHYHPNIKNFVLPQVQEQYSENKTDSQIMVRIHFIDGAKKSQNIKQISDLSQKDLIQSTPQCISLSESIKQSDSIQQSMNSQIQNIKNCQTKEKTESNFRFTKQISKSTVVLPYSIQKSFHIQDCGQTQKSDIIDSVLFERHTNILIQADDLQSSKAQKMFNKKKNNSNQHDKQNINCNLNGEQNLDQNIIVSCSKKDKSILEKNCLKKGKKQKNSSTLDLTNKIRKTSQKVHSQQIGGINKRKNDELPLSRQIPKSLKKRNVEKSSRKCSVGKIISQSAQIISSKNTVKDKYCMSQHSTIVLKQMVNCRAKRQKQNHAHHQVNQLLSMEIKQNMNDFIGHIYEKSISRPKKSSHCISSENYMADKRSDKNSTMNPVNLNVKQGTYEKPLALRMYQNVGKLRDKYLMG